MNKPINCHLWQSARVEASDLHPKASFEEIKKYIDESHDIRKLLKCKQCGQLYLYDFHEEIDWSDGDDSSYRTYIPVDTEAEADEISDVSHWNLHNYSPRLQWDSPPVGSRPPVYWIGKD